MNLTHLIRRKRDGAALTAVEIQQVVEQYTAGHFPDYQMSALAMAICFVGMNDEETAALTEAKLRSGNTLQWPHATRRDRPVVDKHSTGGIGDKVSLILAPLLACAGMRVPMISGRGLGATGGTLDKLESIPGFRTHLTLEELQRVTEQIGCVITGATDDIAPADRKLYALRDVTATVESIPLITASIMSKKLVEGLDALVLDVKFGSGAFMKNIDEARALARSLVQTGQRMGVSTSALLTDMNQPLGRMIGNAVEVNESIDTLRGEGPEDLTEATLALGAELLRLANVGQDVDENRALLQKHIASGAALEKFREMVAVQGGDLDAARPIAPTRDLLASRSGFIKSINAQVLGEAVIELGGGRKVLADKIDHSVGLEMLARIGDRVEQGQPLLHIFGHGAHADVAMRMIEPAIVIGDEEVARPPLIVERIAEERGRESFSPSSYAAACTIVIAKKTPDPVSVVAVHPETSAPIIDARYRQALVDAAIEVRERAYCPYSNYAVGAAVLSFSGKIYVGCNVENASYGLTICAERAAVSHAVADGTHELAALALATENGGAPCGACRQVLAEFRDRSEGDLLILLVHTEDPGNVIETSLDELLIMRFTHAGLPPRDR